MLPAGSRLTRREEFASVIRRGRRGGRERLVVHLDLEGAHGVAVRTGDSVDAGGAVSTVDTPTDARPRAGFVVSRAVGGSVVRHRVARRLRHIVAARLAVLPPGTRLVVRALPAAAGASSAELAADLDSGVRGALRKAGVR